jgi:2-oxoglutarate dehydrogenase complex dehydrogenase (E1) component-like enzyme
MVKHLAWADRFERFLAKRFNTAKRFGVEGAFSHCRVAASQQ